MCMCVIQCVFSNLVQDADGDTALITACEHGFIEIAKVLLEHGAAMDYQNKVKCFKVAFLSENLQMSISP